MTRDFINNYPFFRNIGACKDCSVHTQLLENFVPVLCGDNSVYGNGVENLSLVGYGESAGFSGFSGFSGSPGSGKTLPASLHTDSPIYKISLVYQSSRIYDNSRALVPILQRILRRNRLRNFHLVDIMEFEGISLFKQLENLYKSGIHITDNMFLFRFKSNQSCHIEKLFVSLEFKYWIKAIVKEDNTLISLSTYLKV